MTKKYFSSKDIDNNFLFEESNIYNKEFFKYIDNKDFIKQLIQNSNINNIHKEIDKLKGNYTITFEKENKVFLFRDVIGINPICYFHNQDAEELFFSTERKYLPVGAVELDPRSYIEYDLKTNKLEIKKREFYFDVNTTINDEYLKVKKQVYNMFVDAIKKRLPKNRDETVGLLFSGGTDSTLMALILEQLGQKFICYTASIKSGNTSEGEDIIYSRNIAKDNNFNWTLCEKDFKNLEDFTEYTKLVTRTIEDRKYTKVSVALPLFVCLEQAKLDKIKTVFSGIGSEEVFADYKRAQDIKDINKICLEGLGNLWIRDLYREYTMARYNNQTIEFPFLDDDFIDYSIKINPDYKIDKSKMKDGEDHESIINKVILRDILRDLGLKEEFVSRKKRAAQYGSKSARIFEKVAASLKIKKQEYLDNL